MRSVLSTGSVVFSAVLALGLFTSCNEAQTPQSAPSRTDNCGSSSKGSNSNLRNSADLALTSSSNCGKGGRDATEQNTDSDNSGDGTGGGGGDGSNTTGGTGTAGFDICKDGLQASSKLGDFSALVSDLCGGQHTIAALRQSGHLYTGGDPVIWNPTPNIQGTLVQLRLFTSAVYTAKITDYWALVQLQVTKPAAYKGHYDYDHAVTLTVGQAGSGSVSYEYLNDPQDGSLVDYLATTNFITLKDGQAYVAATKETQKKETMKALLGLIILNKTADGKTEVFAVSDQTLEVSTASDAQTAENRSLNTLGAEQKRAWGNATKAADAPGLLGGG